MEWKGKVEDAVILSVHTLDVEVKGIKSPNKGILEQESCRKGTHLGYIRTIAKERVVE